MHNILLFYITVPELKVAKKIAKSLLQEKLIACANIFPIHSIYEWKNEIKDDNEFVLILKTKSENQDLLLSEIKKLHPYSVPCTIKINAEVNQEFFNWMK